MRTLLHRHRGAGQVRQELHEVILQPALQLIDRLGFVACVGKADGVVSEIAVNGAVNKTAITAAGCASMGEKLVVPAGSDIVVGVAVRDPAGNRWATASSSTGMVRESGVPCR